ncbi:MAG TPA: hypothetical protein VFF30_02655 [Nitrososphaerales archaeon]|nr:hypothetical protein [Nitrososphaerales archaeon]
MMLPRVCSSCGAPLTAENLGALIPEDDDGDKAYCEKCKLKAVDDYSDWKEVQKLR